MKVLPSKLDQKIQTKLAALKAKNLQRQRITIDARRAAHSYVKGHNLVNFACNDYLSLGQHPVIKKAFQKGLDNFGFGSGSSALLSGFSSAHHDLEQAFADYLDRERALFFNSGYMANIGVLPALIDRHMTVVSDKQCHASLLDGIALSRAKHIRYRHQDMADLHRILHTHKTDFIISESLFSMQGSLSDPQALQQLIKNKSCKLILDDAHGLGVLAKQGRSCAAQYSSSQLPCLMSPLGKTFAGVGAIVSGPKDWMELILQTARSYHYTTALPAAIATALLKMITVVQAADDRREKLFQLSQFFHQQAIEKGLQLYSDAQSPIKAIAIPSIDKALSIQKKLATHGIWLPCIRPPSVAKPILRASLNYAHTKEEIKQLLEAVARC